MVISVMRNHRSQHAALHAKRFDRRVASGLVGSTRDSSWRGRTGNNVGGGELG